VSPVELRRLRYFVAVAEEGGFTRASHVLRIAQPALSQQIRLLEDEIGAPLLNREKGSRGVSLTQIGEAMLAEARDILGHVDRSLSAVRRAAENQPVLVRLGVPAGVQPAFLAELTARLKHIPGTELEPAPTTTARALPALTEGYLDLALIHLPVTGSVMMLPVLDEPMGLWLPRGHSLIESETVLLAALDGLPVGIFERLIAPDYYDCLCSVLASRDIHPDWRPLEVTDAAASARVVARGIAQIGIRDVPVALPGMTWRRLEGDLLRLVTALAWKPGPSAVLRECITAVLPLAVGGPTVEPYVKGADRAGRGAAEGPR
jgi:DNA-binding transcriptional LysR family regulator